MALALSFAAPAKLLLGGVVSTAAACLSALTPVVAALAGSAAAVAPLGVVALPSPEVISFVAAGCAAVVDPTAVEADVAGALVADVVPSVVVAAFAGLSTDGFVVFAFEAAGKQKS